MAVSVLELLLTARYVGGTAFQSMANDIDTLVAKSDGFQKVGAAFSAMGTLMLAGGVAASLALGASVRAAAEYDTALYRLVATHSIAGSQMAEFSQQIMSSAEQYGLNTQDMAQGSYFLLSALQSLGYTAQDAFNNRIIPAFAAFVEASGAGQAGSVDFTQAAQDMVHVLSGMGVPMSQWAMQLGNMTKVEQATALSQQQLVQGVLRAAPQAGTLGITPQALFAEIGAMAAGGVLGSRGGTELASAWRTLLTGSHVATGLAMMGLDTSQLYDKGGNLLPQDVLLPLLVQHMAGLTGVQRTVATTDIFGAVGGRAMMQLLSPSFFGRFKDLMRIQQGGAQYLFGTAGAMVDNPPGHLRELGTAIQNLGILAGTALLNGLNPLIVGLRRFIDTIMDFIIHNPAAATKIAEATPLGLLAGGVAMKGIGAFFQSGMAKPVVGGIGNLLGAAGGIGSKIGLAALPEGVGGAAAGIAGVGGGLLAILPVLLVAAGAITVIVLAFTRFRAESTALVGHIQSALIPIWNRFKDAVGVAWRDVQQAFSKAWPDIKKAMDELFPAVNRLMPLFQLLAGIIGGVILVILGLLVGLAHGIASALPSIINFFKDIANEFGSFFQLIDDLIHHRWGKAWHDFLDMFKNAWLTLWDFMNAIVRFIGGFVGGIIKFFQDLFDKLVGHSIIPDMIHAIVAWFAKLPQMVLSALAGLVGQLLSFFGNLASQAVKWGENIVTGIANGIRNSIGGALSGAMSAVTSFIGSHMPHSPAKQGELMHLGEYGPNFINLLAKGMTDNIHLIRRASAEVGTAMGGGLQRGWPSGPIDVNVRNFPTPSPQQDPLNTFWEAKRRQQMNAVNDARYYEDNDNIDWKYRIATQYTR